MSKSLAGVVLCLATVVTFTIPVRGGSPTGSVTVLGVRTMQVCVNDPDDAPGTSETVELHIDNALYDRFTVADSGCVTREYAPFGPSNHPIHIYAMDSQGQPRTLIFQTVLTETCASLGVGSKLEGFCNDPSGQNYYPTRQLKTKPLVSPLVWAGVDTAGGGAIRQLYSSDRSFNLLDEHPGGAFQLSLWGGASGPPLPPGADNGCNGWNPIGLTLMNLIQTQGPECSWVKEVPFTHLVETVGITTYLPDPENHIRQWTLPDFHIWTAAYNRGDHLEVNYRFINDTPWDFGVPAPNDQEIPAIHLNQGMNDRFFWGTGGTGYQQVNSHGTPNGVARLVVPGISPPYNEPNIFPWTGSWVSVCDAANRCLTVAPHDPPHAGGINMATLWSNVSIGNTLANYMGLLGRFSLPGQPSAPGQIDKSIKLYVFPYPFWANAGGVSVLSRIQQLRGWL